MEEGFYEQIITDAVAKKIAGLNNPQLVIEKFKKEDGAIYLNRFFQSIIQQAFAQIISSRDDIAKPKLIALSNQLIQLISEFTSDGDFLEDKVVENGEILKALFLSEKYDRANIDNHIKEVFPFTGLSESELFSGNKAGISLDSELKKEMLSSDEIWWLVSFIKFEGIRLFEQVFRTLEQQGKKVKIICTVYMGATDFKAIEFLSQFSNIEIKISFNTRHERLHAKSYIFKRNSGFHTAYIGSSNLSRSALTSGLEWNLKITQQEIPHIITKCQDTFITYWNDPNFVLYNPETNRDELLEALSQGKTPFSIPDENTPFFSISLFDFQKQILAQLEACRLRGERKNLIVAATGTGKTVMSAFDFKHYLKVKPTAKFLFVAHREEILRQARITFRQILRDSSFGELWVGNNTPNGYNQLFVSIQTLNNNIDSLLLSPNFYDYIVIDEVHHSAASSYQRLLNKFTPELLIGLTATPERHDGNDITIYFGNVISAEIRLPEALNRRLLSPFQYFGLSDDTDISTVSWRRGRYDITQLEKVYTEDHRRVKDILRNCEKYLKNFNDVRALGFCVSQKHAAFMNKMFSDANLKSAVLTSDQNDDRNKIIQQLRRKEINYLFVVDIFNEGVDIPEIDTLLFLRPTESLTIFLQQLGRGLRIHEDKEYLTVLDFVGQSNAEYSFEHKFRGMLGKTHTLIKDEIANGFPHLPLGCSIFLEKTAQEIIIGSISRNTRGGKLAIIKAIRRFKDEYSIECSLMNFSEYNEISIQKIYDTENLWFELLAYAENKEVLVDEKSRNLAKIMSATWQSTDSYSYFKFIQTQLIQGFTEVKNTEGEYMLLMLYYDLFKDAPKMQNINELLIFLRNYFCNEQIKQEVIYYLELRISSLESIEKEIQLPYKIALKLHGRYNRRQILAGMGASNLLLRPESREGVFVIKEKNTELFFVTLNKSKGKFNPTTMYHDYFINDELFHWQSQNATSTDSPTGQAYVNQIENKRTILLFIREANNDEEKLTMAFVFCGTLTYISHTGNKPMNILWRLNQLPPALLLNEGKKLAVG